MFDTSFSIFASGCPAAFFFGSAFFCFFALGGVVESKVSSCNEARSSSDISSSVSGLGRFFEAAGLFFRVACVGFFGAALVLVAAAFFGAALGFAFCDTSALAKS
jgi:hypothetical protein